MFIDPKDDEEIVDEEIVDEEESYLGDPDDDEEDTTLDLPDDDGEDESTENAESDEPETEDIDPRQKPKRPLGNGGKGDPTIGFKTDADVVLVIDLTGSMEPFLSSVKKEALNFEDKLRKALKTKQRSLRKLRIKVIGYRDFYYDWVDPEHPPIQQSEFFTLPEEKEAFSDFVNSLEQAGGEDVPETALEALSMAFRSDWNVPEDDAKTRQIVVLFTDAPAHPLDDPKRFDPEFNQHYPEGMPASLLELQSDYMSPDIFPASTDGTIRGHRLILFAPENAYPWKEVKDWEACVAQSMDPDNGLDGLDMEVVYSLLGGSMA